MLFDFYLRPLEEIQPWGNPDQLNLHWFGLTDGCYRLQVGTECLLNYSDAFIDDRKKQFPDAYGGPYTDYYVVRLWEDLLNILPNILEPLPAELARIFAPDLTAWFNWFDAAVNWDEHQSAPEEPPEEQDPFELLVGWQQARQLNTAYLKHHPRIWFWSSGDNVTISWDSQILCAGLPVWSATWGHYSISRNQFLTEVHAFNDRLMTEMSARVNFVCERWNRPKIYVDTQQLSKEQNDRSTWLQDALQQPASTSWDKVLAAIWLISDPRPGS
uniref:Uncharacterized protein n=1 Tax=Cyanothece sp. (strain PCC 7425 / ATCC 29141) TaxID=395961 RepID=B8HYN2_CYAP4